MTGKKNVCIVIPIYNDSMTELELLSFQRIIKIFHTREIKIICSPSIIEYIKSLCEAYENVSYLTFDKRFFKGIRGYNRLMISYGFYNHFCSFDYMLICQLDVFVIKDDLDYWTIQGQDNIGAPIFEGYTNPTFIIKKNGNNGGFCLRNPKSCLKVLSEIKIRYSKVSSLWRMESIWYWKIFRAIRDGLIFNYNIRFLKPLLNEDVFWSVVVPEKFPWFKACEPEKAKYFAFDAHPRYLFQECNYTYPMAIHAWWRYDKDFCMEVIKSVQSMNESDIQRINSI
jgi:hypothetical protein